MTQAEALPLRIQVLRRLNPVIRCVLQSPLHSVASKRLLVLGYQGRKSGAQYQIPLVYVSHAGHIYCVTRDTAWWKSAVQAPFVTVWLRGASQRMRAERADPGAPETRAAFVQFLRDNPGTAQLIYQVPVDARGEPDAAAVDAQLPQSNLIRFSAS